MVHAWCLPACRQFVATYSLTTGFRAVHFPAPTQVWTVFSTAREIILTETARIPYQKRCTMQPAGPDPAVN